MVAIAVETPADLEALPVRARTGEWLTFDARLHVRAARPVLFVLGPRGTPRTVPTSMDSQGHVRAHFALDHAGAYTVQLVAELELGPQPLLEARVFADATPALRDPDARVPGEEAGGGGQDADALARMIVALRAQESLPPLVRDDRLDRLARAHADRMKDRQRVGHDVGDGDPRSRFEAENSSVAVLGENVVHAATVEAAHRSLYESPSHRMNLLRADYTHYGVAVAQAEDGSVYACEMFTR